MCENECISKGKCEHDAECHNDVCFTSEQSKTVEKLIAKAKENERTKTIEEMARRLNLKFVELPLDDLIVSDILKEIGRVAKQMKGDKE